jgi:hypothetical protein
MIWKLKVDDYSCVVIVDGEFSCDKDTTYSYLDF